MFSSTDQKEAFKKSVGTQMMKSITTKRFSRFLHLKQNILQHATRVTWQKPATNKISYDSLQVTD